MTCPETCGCGEPCERGGDHYVHRSDHGDGWCEWGSIPDGVLAEITARYESASARRTAKEMG